jgi:hypothetical protein
VCSQDLIRSVSLPPWGSPLRRGLGWDIALAGAHIPSSRAPLNSSPFRKENSFLILTYEGNCLCWCSHFLKAARFSEVSWAKARKFETGFRRASSSVAFNLRITINKAAVEFLFSKLDHEWGRI